MWSACVALGGVTETALTLFRMSSGVSAVVVAAEGKVVVGAGASVLPQLNVSAVTRSRVFRILPPMVLDSTILKRALLLPGESLSPGSPASDVRGETQRLTLHDARHEIAYNLISDQVGLAFAGSQIDDGWAVHTPEPFFSALLNEGR
jgi:hypothetical protein